jgi:hypothetical protein
MSSNALDLRSVRYTDPARVLQDVQRLLPAYPGLVPRQDYLKIDFVELLLTICGTIQILFKNSKYNIPVHFTIPLQVSNTLS